MRIVQILSSAWGPGLVVLLTLIALFAFDASGVAILLGFGTGTLGAPIVFAVVALTGIAARKWWQSLIGVALAVTLTLFLFRPLGDEPPGWEVIKDLGAACVFTLIIALISGFRDALLSMRRR